MYLLIAASYFFILGMYMITIYQIKEDYRKQIGLLSNKNSFLGEYKNEDYLNKQYTSSSSASNTLHYMKVHYK